MKKISKKQILRAKFIALMFLGVGIVVSGLILGAWGVMQSIVSYSIYWGAVVGMVALAVVGGWVLRQAEKMLPDVSFNMFNLK